jgi:hypothetical protein
MYIDDVQDLVTRVVATASPRPGTLKNIIWEHEGGRQNGAGPQPAINY